MPSRLSAPLVLALICSCGLLGACEAKGGLRTWRADDLEYDSILSEVEAYLGKERTKIQTIRLETELATMFAALPKNERGRLARPTVRYALHQLFARHGRVVNSLDPDGGAWNESSPTGVLSERAPASLEATLEERLADHGFGLKELAVLATATRHLFTTEDTKRLNAAYKAHGLSIEEILSADKMYEVLDTYMAIYLLESNLSDVSWVVRSRSRIPAMYPGWESAKSWAHDMRGNMAFVERDRSNPFVTRGFDFSDILHVVEEISEQYGLFQDEECKELRDSLLEHEYGETGRVRLADFHDSALQGKWQFSESKAYLRQLGALDESDPFDPSVVVPNYVYSKTNCVARSSLYSVCCIEECAGLREHVQRSLAKPDASPQQIAAVVSHLPSSTVPAPRNLSQLLLQRLDAIAAIHHGAVPLHGRLFHQWMHHAYPRECPYPHLSGTTRPLTAEMWFRETGERNVATKEEMRHHAKNASRLKPREVGEAAAYQDDIEAGFLPWSDEEELLYYEQVETVNGNHVLERVRVYLLFMAILAAMGAMAVSLNKTMRTTWSSLASANTEKHCV